MVLRMPLGVSQPEVRICFESGGKILTSAEPTGKVRINLVPARSELKHFQFSQFPHVFLGLIILSCECAFSFT